MFVSKLSAQVTKTKRRLILFAGVMTSVTLMGVTVASAATPGSVLGINHANQCVSYSSLNVHKFSDQVVNRSRNYYHSSINGSGQSINDVIDQVNTLLAHAADTSSPADTQSLIAQINKVVDQLNASKVSTGQASSGTRQVDSMLGQLQNQVASPSTGSRTVACKSTTGGTSRTPTKPSTTGSVTQSPSRTVAPTKPTSGVSQASSATGVRMSNGPTILKNKSVNNQWAGYVDYGTNFTFVTGSWVIPDVKCSNEDEVFGAWVGIDGATEDSQTVEQLGSDVECQGGKAVQAPWWEMYPGPSHYLDSKKYPLSVGDTLTASVTASGQNFILAMSAQSKTHAPWKFSTTQKGPGVKRNSAEWIVEAPTADGGQNTNIPQFGDFVFTNCRTVMNGTGYKISQLKGEQTELRDNRGQVRTVTSSLGADGQSFRVAHTR